MKNKLKFIPFLLAVPLLFMGNAPYPYETEKTYKDFTVEVVSYTHDTSTHEVVLDITNTGTGFLSLGNLTAEIGDDNYRLEKPIINNVVAESYGFYLPPNESETVVYDLRGNLGINFASASFAARAFSTYESVDMTNVEIEAVNTNVEADKTTYNFKVFGLSGFEKDYNYSGMTVINVKGHKLAAYSTNWDSGKTEFTITTYDTSIIEDDFAFAELYRIKGRVHYGATIGAFFEGLAYAIFTIFWVVILVAAIIFVVLPAILIPIIVVTSKKRRNKSSPPNDSGSTT